MKKSKIYGLVLLACLLFVNAQALIRKDQNIQTPISDNLSVSWGDINQLNWKLNTAFFAIIVWFLTEAYKSYQSSKDRTSQTLEQLVKTVGRIEARLESTPTKQEVALQIREEIKYLEDIKNGG